MIDSNSDMHQDGSAGGTLPSETPVELDRKLRVCLVTSEYPPAVGGLGKSAQRIAVQLSRSGFEIHVFTPAPSGRIPLIEASDGVVVHQVDCHVLLPKVSVRGMNFWLVARRGRTRGKAPELQSAIRKVQAARPFDIFHAFGLWVAPPCHELAQSFGKPLVLSIRGADGVDLRWNGQWIEALRDASWVTSVSRDSLERAKALTNVSNRCSFVPNGIELGNFPSWEPTSANRGVVGTVASFRRKKNLPLLLEAYSLLPPTSRTRLRLVGGFRNRADAEDWDADGSREALGIAPEVELTGIVPNDQVPQYLQSMRVFALSSDHEGLPNSVLEAAATGVPIVATAVDGIKDVFRDGEEALLVPPGDAEALARAIQRVLDDESLARQLSAGGRAVAGRLTVDSERQAYVDLYRKLVEIPSVVEPNAREC